MILYEQILVVTTRTFQYSHSLFLKHSYDLRCPPSWGILKTFCFLKSRNVFFKQSTMNMSLNIQKDFQLIQILILDCLRVSLEIRTG